jgi:hypothetical protein
MGPDGATGAGGVAGTRGCVGASGDHLLYRGVQAGLPRLGWTGSEYAFAFPSQSSSSFESFFGLADPTGSVTTAPRQFTPNDALWSSFPRFAVATDGFGVAYLDVDVAAPGAGADGGRYGRQVHFARLDPTGALVAGSEVLVSDPASGGEAVSIAWDPVDRIYAVVWFTTYSGLHMRRFDATGAPIASADTRIGSGMLAHTGTPFIWTGDRFAVLSRSLAPAPPGSPLTLREVLADGTVVRTVDLGLSGFGAALAHGGSEYGVVWQQDGGVVEFARIDASGVVAGSRLVLDAGPYAGDADIVRGAGEYGVTWHRGSATNPYDVFFARVTATGTVAETSRLTASPEHDWWPSITWCGQYAVAYVRGAARLGEESELRVVFP